MTSVDLSCPNGCIDLEISGGVDAVDQDDQAYLEETALADDVDDRDCPDCGADMKVDWEGSA